MYRITCHTCGASIISPSGDADALACGCCKIAHSHNEAANNCPGQDGGHPGELCPSPDAGVGCTAVTPAGEICPGGHCHVKIADCRVCRSVDLAWIGMAPVGPVVVS
jgi:hypothetical protein